jgi:hypothetical protein
MVRATRPGKEARPSRTREPVAATIVKGSSIPDALVPCRKTNRAVLAWSDVSERRTAPGVRKWTARKDSTAANLEQILVPIMFARRLIKALMGTVYFSCLAIVSLTLTFTAAIVVWETCRLGRATGFGDDVTFLAIPPGIGLGILVAGVSRRWVWAHWLFVVLGVLCLLAALSAGDWIGRCCETWRHRMGPLRGLADSIERLVVFGATFVGSLFLISGVAGLLSDSVASGTTRADRSTIPSRAGARTDSPRS